MGEEPQDLELILDSAWMARELEGTCRADGSDSFAASGRALLQVSRLGSRIQVSGQVDASFEVTCARCLEPARIQVSDPFFMLFEEAPGAPLAQEVELIEEDLSWETFVGPEIDLAPLLREHLLLAVPMNPLCRQDCPGLIQHLERPGSDAMQESPRLQAEGKAVDPRWNELAKLKLIK